MEKDNILFEVNDYQHLNKLILELSIGIVLMALIYFGYFEEGMNKNLAQIIFIYMITSSIFRIGIYAFNKHYMIKFFDNQIIRTNKNLEVKIDDITEIYRLSSLFYYGYNTIKRAGILMKLLSFIIFIFLAPLFILFHVVLSLYYHVFPIHEFIIIVGKNDKEVVVIQISNKDKDKQAELFNYFKKYLKTDINELKTLWFLPVKR